MTHKTLQRTSVYREIIIEKKQQHYVRRFSVVLSLWSITTTLWLLVTTLLWSLFFLYVRRETYCVRPNYSSSASASSYITLFGGGAVLVRLQEQCLHITLGHVEESHIKVRPLWTWPLRSMSNVFIFISGMLTCGYFIFLQITDCIMWHRTFIY